MNMHVVPAKAQPRVWLWQIVDAVSFETGVKPSDIHGPSRLRRNTRVRAAVMWLARRLTDSSLQRIGNALGGRDHTTVLYSLGVAERYRDTDPAFRMLTDRVVRQFQQSKEN